MSSANAVATALNGEVTIARDRLSVAYEEVTTGS